MSSGGESQCGRCGAAVGVAMRFCPQCGKEQSKGQSEVGRRLWASVAGTAVVFFLVPLGIKEGLTWKRGIERPTKSFAPVEAEEEVVDDPHVRALKQEIEANPEDLEKLRALAAVLSEKVRTTPEAPPALVFEAIDALSRIVAREPNDAEALVTLADISFDQKAFTKALDFYQRYLRLKGDDAGARARYASTLTFLGRYDESVTELQGIITKDPKNFPALAYLAITYAQSGAIPKAKEVAATALAAAPSEEARTRFGAFVKSLDTMGDGAGARPANGGSAAAAEAQGSGAVGIEGFIAALKGSPVAGPKFVRHEVGDGTVRLYFREFPMNQMPPFAKEKFFGGLIRSAQAMQLTSVKRIVFMDEGSGGEMDSLTVGE